MPIPHLDIGGNGPLLHFAHANGYPPECYRPLLERLSTHYHVLAMHQHPLWPEAKPADLPDWHPLTDDFLRFLDEHNAGPLFGVGHSMGGVVTLRAALRQPQHFRALVLIDPVLFPPSFIFIWELVTKLGLAYRLHPLAGNALHRRKVFQSRESLIEGYRRKAVFRRMDDKALQAYVTGITRQRRDGKFELVYSPEWEAHIYVTGVLRAARTWQELPGLKVPLMIIRGAQTDTFWASTARLVQRKLPSTHIVNIPDSGHLVPLERPAEVYQTIQDFLLGT